MLLNLDCSGEPSMSTLKRWKIPFFKNEPREGPPDLEALIRKMRAHFSGQFSKSFKYKKGKQPAGKNPLPGLGKGGALFIGGAILGLWFLAGIFIVSPAEQSAILYFGKYAKTVGPGPHWIPRLIASRYTVNVQQIAMFPYQAEMLTKDENIVSVDIAVQYRIDNVRDYLFNVVDPIGSLHQATASALRQVVGQTTLDEILTTGRGHVRDQVSHQVKKILALYKSGLLITDVTLQPVKPPEQVTEAFDDAIKAREDEQRYINQAQAYAKRVVATAQGQASRILQEANAQKQKSILLAQGETAAFLELLPQYQRAPEIMTERMYLETMSFILSRSSKILLDAKSSNQMFYVPLDKLISNSNQVQPTPAPSPKGILMQNQAARLEQSSDNLRFQPRGSYSFDDKGGR